MRTRAFPARLRSCLALPLAALAAAPLTASAQDIDPCALVTADEVSAAVGIRGLGHTTHRERGVVACIFSQPYTPIANVNVLQTKNARLAAGQTSVADIFEADRAAETRAKTDVPGLRMAAYSVDKMIVILVDQDTRLSVFVPGIADVAKATQVARDLAEKALSRMN